MIEERKMRSWMMVMTLLAALWAPWGRSPAMAQLTAEAQNTAASCSSEAECNDGLFCTGEETCSNGTCEAGTDPCPGRACDEGLDLCLPGLSPRLEAGWLRVGSTPKTVLLAQEYHRPVVVAHTHYEATDPPMVVRVKQVTANSLELFLESPSAASPLLRRVSYLVMESGAWEVNGWKFEAQRLSSTLTDREGQMVGEPATFLQTYQEPVVVGQVMSARDDEWSLFWASDDTVLQPPAWDSLRVGKTVGADPQAAREEEILGFVVFEAGRGRLGNVEIEAGVTADGVLGMDNSPQPFQHAFEEPFERAPQVALASLAGQKRPDVGWPVIPERGPAINRTIGHRLGLSFLVDEDQLGDGERGHNSERVAYLAFSRPFTFSKSPVPEAITFPGGSDYYSCRIDDERMLSRSCSDALPAIAQSISACEQEVDSCPSGFGTAKDCGECLAKLGDWKKLPYLKLATCIPKCGIKLLEFITCRHAAHSFLQSAVFNDICLECGGPDCNSTYGLNATVTGLRCDEFVPATAKCGNGEELAFQLDYKNVSLNFPLWCPHPHGWSVELDKVKSFGDPSWERACKVIEQSGNSGVNGTVQANFDCSCAGTECGDPNPVNLEGKISCMPVNSWFRIRTKVTNVCGEDPRQREVTVHYSDPLPTPFPIPVHALPGEEVKSELVAYSSGDSCFFEGGPDTTISRNPQDGKFTVAEVRCQGGGSRAASCAQVQLAGTVTGDGLDVRPNGVTVNLTVGATTETKTVTSGSFSFQTVGVPGQSYSVAVVDPVYAYGVNGRNKVLCLVQGASSGILPQSATAQVATIGCSHEVATTPPPRPVSPLGEIPPFEWGWESNLNCEFLCDSDQSTGGGDPEPCDPCFCRDENTGVCPERCYCGSTDVIAGRCKFDCDYFFTSSPALSVTAAAQPSSSGLLRAGDFLNVSGSAEDDDGLQGFVFSVDGVYVDHVVSTGTSGSFNDLAIDTSSLAPGPHTLQVIAIDDHPSARTPAFVDLPFEVDHSVDPCEGDTLPPALTITAPASGATLSPGPVQIQATSTDAGVGVREVKFWVGGQYLGLDSNAPYQKSWTATPGTHTIRLWARDHCGRGRQEEITVTVTDPCAGASPPTVAITNYQDGQWVDPALMHFEATAQDFSGTGIDRVEFEVESFSNVAVDTVPPYISSGWWLLSEGDEVITARAFDGCGRAATDSITVHVSESASVCSLDQFAPLAFVAQPSEGQVLQAGPVTIRANASDDSLLLAAVLEVDGALVPGGTVLSSDPNQYVWTWNATPGTHRIRVKVADVCWETAWSQPRTVTVQ